MEAISDVYESQWTGADALNAQTLQIDTLWQDFSHKLGDQVLIPLNTYTAQFPEMKVFNFAIIFFLISINLTNKMCVFFSSNSEKNRKT